MKRIPNYGDKRMLAYCAYCGGETQTKDHVPSRILLDEPFPEDLPTVWACETCNRGFASDEEYVACLIECALHGSCNSDGVTRDKVKRTLSHSSGLTARLKAARKQTPSGVYFETENERVRNVILKLARGHAAFELNEPRIEEPDAVMVCPFTNMLGKDREQFEMLPVSSIWPEVGCMAMQRLVVDTPGASTWIVVQRDRYRYLTSVSCDGTLIRIVLSEYLACEVAWQC